MTTTRNALHERMLRQMTPEQALGIEVLCQAIRDARHDDYTSASVLRYPATSWQGRENKAHRDARTWFLTQEAEVRWWLDMLELPEWCYAELLATAGLTQEVT